MVVYHLVRPQPGAVVKSTTASYDPVMLPPAPPAVTAGDVLTLAELRDLRRISGFRSAGLVLHAWATIVGAMVVYAVWPSAVTLVMAGALIGARQLGLMVLMHEAAHWRLFAHPRLNNGVAQWLCAHPVWGDLASYRRRHHLHHRHTLQAEDPDLALSTPDPPFWRAVLRDLLGVTACVRVRGWRLWRERAPQAWTALRAPLVCNAVILGVLGGLGHWELYLLLWLLPLVTWYQLVTRIRNLAEHALVPDHADPLLNTRTVHAGLLARIFVAPYWVNYHLEHHLLVFVPCWKLSRAHAILVAKGYAPRMEVATGYLDVIRRVTSGR